MELLGFYPVTEYDPWVADVWGYVDERGREFALLPVGDRLLVLDCTDPAQPVLASEVASPTSSFDAKDVKTWRSYAYVCHEFGPVLIIDLSDPFAAQSVGSIPQASLCTPTPCGFEFDGGAHNLWIDDLGLLYVAGVHHSGVQIYDVAESPEAPRFLGMLEPGEAQFYVHDLYAQDGVVYAARPGGAARTAGWDIFEVVSRDPLETRLVGTAPQSGNRYVHACWVSPDRQVLLATEEGEGARLFAFDITLPEAPRLLGEFGVDPSSSIHNVQIREEFAFVSYYNHGLRVLDLSDPAALQEVAWYVDTEWSDNSCTDQIYRGVWGVYAGQPSGSIYLSEMCGGGLYVVRFDGLDPDVAAPEAGRLRIAPQPAVGFPVELGARVSPNEPLRFEVWDAAGRRVRTRAFGAPADSIWFVAWDGTGSGGERLPAGRFWARLRQGGRQWSAPLTVLR